MSLILLPSAHTDLLAIEEFKASFVNNGEFKVPGSCGLMHIEAEEWRDIQRTKFSESGTKCFFVKQPKTTVILGVLRISPILADEELQQFGGHLGGAVRPSARGQGISTEQIRLGCTYLRLLGVEKVLITCVDGNKAAERSISKTGGIYHNTVWYEREAVNLRRFYIPNGGVNIVD